jgi:hypothetical protein
MAFSSDAYNDNDYHIIESPHLSIEQFDAIVSEYSHLKEILALPPSYESLTESSELLNQINQWESETIRQVNQTAEAIREKIRQRSDMITTERFQPEFDHLTQLLNRSQWNDRNNESDLQQLVTRLKALKVQVDNSLLNTAEIRSSPIDWSKHIYVIRKQVLPQRNDVVINLNRLNNIRPRISVDVRGADWHILSTPSPINPAFLHYQHSQKNKRLSLVRLSGQQASISWFNDQSIWDICWSSFLNKFIILADTQLYTYDETILSNPIELIDAVRPKRDKMEFLRCSCSNETILITYDERNSSIDEYHMEQWTLVHHYENLVKKNALIISLSFSSTNSNLIGMTIDDRGYWHFELRDRALLLVSTIQLDKSEFNRRLISLPNSTTHWLIGHMGSKLVTVIDQNGQNKRTIELAENSDLLTYSTERNCLVVLSQKSKLRFFDL